MFFLREGIEMNGWQFERKYSWLLIAAFIAAGCESAQEEAKSMAPKEQEMEGNPESEADELEAPGTTRGTQYQNIRLTEVVSDLEHPWSVAFLSEDKMLITERPGRLQLIEGSDRTEVSGVPKVSTRNQGGLLEVSLHPEFEENSLVYLTYSKKAESGDDTALAVARGRLEGAGLVEVEDIFVQDRYSSPGRHYGSRIAWLPDGTMLVTIGDRGTEPRRAQDLGDHAGSVLRLNDDGTVPENNPFVDDEDARDEIYTYGNRNIQGLVVHPETGDIWATEHGPRGGDELNLLKPGENYGWPRATLGLDYRSQEEFPDAEARRIEGMVNPVHEFMPPLAPSGLALITTNRFDRWEGNLLAGGLRAQRLLRIVFDEDEVYHIEELLLQEVGRIRDVREGPDGNIYVLTDAVSGSLYRIEPT